MKIITVNSKTYGKKEILVDDIDYPHLVKHHWVLDKNKNTFYAYHRGSDPAGKLVKWKMHRVLLGLSKEKSVGDHIDGNGLNNQRSNLRIATHAGNAQNRRYVPNKSGFKGVCVQTINDRPYYVVTVTKDGKKINKCGFKTAEEAAKAYNELAKEHHGEFAYQNPV